MKALVKSECRRQYGMRHLTPLLAAPENQSALRGDPNESLREPREPGIEVGVFQVWVETLEAQLERERQDRDCEREDCERERERKTIRQRKRDTVDDLRRRGRR